MTSAIEVIYPVWPEPEKVSANVSALVTTRSGGVSTGVYQTLNLANHVGDTVEAVSQNRILLKETLDLPSEPVWLNQTHSTRVVKLPFSNNKTTQSQVTNADASWTKTPNVVCAVMTADCLPVFFYHNNDKSVAVAHAGWRGLADGILEKTLREMTSSPEELQVWLGPAIGAQRFEVGEEVRDIFCQHDPKATESFQYSKQSANKKFYIADIYRLAKDRLYNAGVASISGGDYCTVSDERFFSYRREGDTGRMASLIWLSDLDS